MLEKGKSKYCWSSRLKHHHISIAGSVATNSKADSYFGNVLIDLPLVPNDRIYRWTVKILRMSHILVGICTKEAAFKNKFAAGWVPIPGC